ncbi:MAG: hypothetical protein PVH22_05360 [Desulfobacteraceae bacterium]
MFLNTVTAFPENNKRRLLFSNTWYVQVMKMRNKLFFRNRFTTGSAF